MGFYIQHNGQQLGPYTLAEVRSQLASGALSLRDPVWWEGQAGWVPLAESSVFDAGFKDPTPARRPVELSGKSPFALATLIMALLSFICGPFTAVPAIVLGHCAFIELRKHPKMTGRSTAITGIIIGYVITLISTAAIGCYFYFQDEIARAADREAAIQAVAPAPVVPIKPAPKALAPAASPAPADSSATPSVATPERNAAPSTNSAPQTNAAPQ